MPQRIRIVIDSTTDLPAEWIQRWGLPMIPAFVNFGGESYPDDGVALPRPAFYQRLAASPALPTTSAPPPGLAEKVLSDTLSTCDHVLAFTVASQLSSIYNTIRLAAEHVDPQRITVYDSGSLSMGLGWQVTTAMEVLERGGSREEVWAAVRSVRARSALWAVPDTLEYLRRGGRVNPLVASIGTLLNIKPIIHFHEGIVNTIQRVRSMGKAIQAIAALAKGAAPIERLALMHSNFEQGTRTLFEQIGDAAPTDAPPIIADVTTAIGVHFGPGALGIALVRAK